MDGEARVYTPDEMMMLGMKCLVDNFGLINAEQFVNSIRAACPDYTLWRRQAFDDMSVDDIFKMVDEDVDNPFERGRRLLNYYQGVCSFCSQGRRSLVVRSAGGLCF